MTHDRRFTEPECYTIHNPSVQLPVEKVTKVRY